MNPVAKEIFPSLEGDALRPLEFDQVVRHLVGRTQTAYGRARALALAALDDRSAIEAALQEATEAGQLLEEKPLPVGSGDDLLPELARLQTEGVKLDAVVLHEVEAVIEAAIACKRRLAGREETPRLQRIAADLTPLPELAGEIRRSIGPRGEILDTASFELADLRDRLRSERAKIKGTLDRLLQDDDLQGVFQESLITDRNNRYVLPVRTDHSGRLKGFVHDVSATGQTLYVEPASVLDGNNRLQTLAREIQHEEDRILAHLSDGVRQASRALADNQSILARLDLRQAVARLTRDLDATIPVLADRPLLEIRDARHPLLVLGYHGGEQTVDVVPIDILLPEEEKVLIISGPNTGGKTVSLKTAGLLVLMTRAGLPIPVAPGSRLYPFDPVLADIGDEQSLEQNLSTFSGHLLRLRQILEDVDEGGLVLLDELGTGTDPVEGAALALAVVDRLRQVGARVLATTHLHMIKGYAQLEDGVVNAAVDFDTETLQPSYRLHFGIPGASHAFTIARRLGLPEEVLESAADYMGHGEREGSEIIERLQSLRMALEEELGSADDLRREAEQERDRRRRLRQDLEDKRQDILNETRIEGSRLLADAEAKLRDLFRQVPKETPLPKERARITSAVRELKKELPAATPQGPETVPQETRVGEILFLPALGIDAEVVAITKGRIELLAGGKKLRQALHSLRQYDPRRFAQKTPTAPRIRDRVTRDAFRPRLVLVGKRVDDAQTMLARFLDEALLHQQQRLEIVHGSGQGILRRAVREFLAERGEVTSFHAAGPSEGGDNVTVVDLRN